MRLGVYMDFAYWRDDDGVSTDEAVVRFITALGRDGTEVVLFGRLNLEPGRSSYALPTGSVRFVPSPVSLYPN